MPQKFRSLSPIDPQGNATMDRSISHSWQFRGCAIKAGKKNLLSNSPVFLGSWYQLLKVNKLKVFNPNQSSLLSMKFLCHSWPKRHNLIGVWLSQYDVIMFNSSPRLSYQPKQRQILCTRVFNPSHNHCSWPFGQIPGLPILKLTWQCRGADQKLAF